MAADGKTTSGAHVHEWKNEISYAETVLQCCPCGLRRYVTWSYGRAVEGKPFKEKVADVEPY